MHCLPTRSQFFPREDGSVQGDDIRTMVKRLGSVLKFRRQNSLAMLENLSKDPNNRILMLQAGVIKPLNQQLLKHGDVQIGAVLSVLCTLAADNSQVRKKLADACIVPNVVTAIASRSQNIKCNAVRLLYYLSIEEEGASQIVDTGVFERLVSLVDDGKEESEEWAIRLIGNLIQRFPAFLAPMIDAGTVQSLIKIACVRCRQMKVQVVRLLAVILETSNSDLSSWFYDRGVYMLVESLTPASGDRECGEWAIRALSVISSCVDCMKALVSDYGMSRILGMLLESCDIVKERALRILFNVTKHSTGIQQELAELVDIVSGFLCADSCVLQEMSAKTLGNVMALDNCLQVRLVTAGVIEKLALGLKSPNHSVVIACLQALKQIIVHNQVRQSYVADIDVIESVMSLCFSEAREVRAIETSLEILNYLCASNSYYQRVLMEHSAIERLIALCESFDMHRIIGEALSLLAQLIATDVGIEAIQTALSSGHRWQVLFGIMQRGVTGNWIVLDIIAAVISATKGEIHSKILDKEITLISESIRKPSVSCQRSGVRSIVSLVESSPVYSLQLVSSGALPALVRLVESCDPELANPATKALGEIALGNYEHKDMIAEACAQPVLIRWLLHGEGCDTIEVLKTLWHIAEEHDGNSKFLASQDLASFLVAEISRATTDEASYSVLLFAVISKSSDVNVQMILEEITVAKVFLNLTAMATRDQEMWQNRALFGIKTLLQGPLIIENDVLESVTDDLICKIYPSCESTSCQARDIIWQITHKLGYIPQCVQDNDMKMMVLLFKSSTVAICEQALDRILGRLHNDTINAACFSEAGGFRILARTLTFGTNNCKTKSALLVSRLGEVSHAFCVESIQCGIMKPLIGLLAMDDSNCRAAASAALSMLLGRDIMGLEHAERIKIIAELLNSKGCEFKEVAGLMRSMDVLSISSGSSQSCHYNEPGSSDFEVDMNKIKETISSSYECLLCPITHEPMIEPVMAADGQVYEREAIETWFRHQVTSPMTNMELPNLSLIPIDDMELQIKRLNR